MSKPTPLHCDHCGQPYLGDYIDSGELHLCPGCAAKAGGDEPKADEPWVPACGKPDFKMPKFRN